MSVEREALLEVEGLVTRYPVPRGVLGAVARRPKEMVHAVEGCDPKHERHTIRSTIQGDYGLGYFEDGKKIGEVYREEVFEDAD